MRTRHGKIVKRAVLLARPALNRWAWLLGAALASLLGTVGLACAQTTSIYMNPLNEVLPRHHVQPRRRASSLNTAPVVSTKTGPVEGTQFYGMNAYLGIPYATPPVGSLRWTPPRPHAKWSLPLAATAFGDSCTQPDGIGGWFGSEDCLTLNVFTPPTSNKNLPVMVWIHGGSLITGGSFGFDPSPLVLNGSVIVVTINYRLGLLGFFAHPAIDSEGHLSGNYGLMDQQLALKWVKQNIAGFGGNPGHITVFGESAGGQSVLAQLASPTAADLFNGAISESGGYDQFQDYFNLIVPLNVAETEGTGIVPSGVAQAAEVGCADQTAQCLRSVPASSLVLADPFLAFPFVDGTVLTQTPTAAFASGQFNRVPVIVGTNHDEYRLFVYQQYDATGNPLTDQQYPDAVAALVGLTVDNSFVQLLINSEYPLNSYPDPAAPLALSTLGTDLFHACPTRNAQRLLSQYVPTYAYEFNDENAPSIFQLPSSFPLGAYHFAEVPYIFDIFQRFSGVDPFTPDQQLLRNAMVTYWTTFVAKGDPNSPSEPMWMPYNTAADEYLSLIPPTPTVETTFDADHKCSSFWDTF